MRIVLEKGDTQRTRKAMLLLAKELQRAARGVPVDATWGTHKGIAKFAREIGVSRQNATRALSGEYAGGGRIRAQWAEWQKRKQGDRE